VGGLSHRLSHAINTVAVYFHRDFFWNKKQQISKDINKRKKRLRAGFQNSKAKLCVKSDVNSG